MELNCYDENDNPTYGYDGKTAVCLDTRNADDVSLRTENRENVSFLSFKIFVSSYRCILSVKGSGLCDCKFEDTPFLGSKDDALDPS